MKFSSLTVLTSM